VGQSAAAASNRADASKLVRENLESQRSAVSGVSLDEESINLLAFQRQYQGAARFISAVDELTQTLLSII
jgi:flagellar hook-associated protein 1 FlgK